MSSRSNPNNGNFRTQPNADADKYLTGQYITAPDDDSVFYDSISNRVLRSEAYKSAYALFVNLSDKSWLQRLVAIPTSVLDAKETWLDQIGASSNFHDKQSANYQYCIEQINALVAEYQQFQNSLPITQANQLAQAGVNAAVTGEGLDGSSINPSRPVSNPSSLQSTNVGEFITNVASFVLDATSGLASVAHSFASLKQTKEMNQFTKDSAFVEIMKYARDNGISFDKGPSLKSWDDLINYKDNYGVVVDAEGESIHLDTLFKNFATSETYAPFFASFIKQNPEAISYFGHTPDNNTISVGSSFVALDAVTDASFEMFKTNLFHQLEVNKYNSEISKYGVDTSEYQSLVAEQNKLQEEYNSKKLEIELGLLKSLYDSSSDIDKLLLMKALVGYNSDDIIIQNVASEFAETERSLGAVQGVGTLLSLIKSILK